MFGKLLKYEFKSLGKWYLSLYAITGLLSLVIGFWVRTITYRAEHSSRFVEHGPATAEAWLLGITVFAFAIIIIGILISTFFLVVSRFYKNIYGRQGYLTMTLPVNSHQLILSKLSAALIWYFIATLVILLSGFIIAGITLSQQIPSMSFLLNQVSNQINLLAGQHFVVLALSLISILIDTVMGILLGYFAISLGQLFKDHRILLAVAFYVGLYFAVSVFQFFTSFAAVNNSMNAEIVSIPNPILMATNLLLAIGFYFGTHYIMTKKLNLQ